MGNALGRRRSVKVMKINGETFKLKAPIRVGSVLANHPGHVLLESEAVKSYGAQAPPLESEQELKPKRLYFLVELPRFPIPEDKSARRVRSGIQMSAKDRLESLMLARRSSSDLTSMKRQSVVSEEERLAGGAEGVRVKMRLPKAEVERLMAESKNQDEVAEKIVNLCMASRSSSSASSAAGWSGELRRLDTEAVKPAVKPREKRVGFLPINEGEARVTNSS